jgi:ferredoxin
MSVAIVGCRSSRSEPFPYGDDLITGVSDLCTHPQPLADIAADAESLVLLIHPEDVELPGLQAAIRRAGFDPFGVPMIDIAGADGDEERLEVMVSGAKARAGTFTGSRPEQARPVMQREISRRALLTIPRPYYEAVPAIDRALCAASNGCTACVERCPKGAYRPSGRRILFDKDGCVTCGLCLTTCPVGAISSPSVSPNAVRAEIEGIIDAAGTAGIAFVCAQSTTPVTEPGWFSVVVPCAGMVPGTWPVAAVLLGAAASAIRPCRDVGCPIGHDERAIAAAEFGRELAAAGGLGIDVIAGSLGGLPALRRDLPVPLSDPFGVHGAAEVVQALNRRSGTIEVAGLVEGLGLVDIDRDACTLCTMCAETCPTGALKARPADNELALTFDAKSCTACKQCLNVCPEIGAGAISVRAAADSRALATGRHVVHEARVATCSTCGRPIAPEPALDRIATLLGEEHTSTLAYVRSTCLDCRGLVPA